MWCLFFIFATKAWAMGYLLDALAQIAVSFAPAAPIDPAHKHTHAHTRVGAYGFTHTHTHIVLPAEISCSFILICCAEPLQPLAEACIRTSAPLRSSSHTAEAVAV